MTSFARSDRTVSAVRSCVAPLAALPGRATAAGLAPRRAALAAWRRIGGVAITLAGVTTLVVQGLDQVRGLV
ncbi:MAG: hypothetical protein GAK40_00664 [Burkholderia plantarii]|nr:MAG: hypothetical protein GAK40_00664 [Burkholderia plantarii]